MKLLSDSDDGHSIEWPSSQIRYVMYLGKEPNRLRLTI